LARLRSFNPRLAALLTVFLATLAGLPPTAGFFVKFYSYVSVFAYSPYLCAFLIVAQAVMLFSYLLFIRFIWIDEFAPSPYTLQLSTTPEFIGLGALLGVVLGISCMLYYPLLQAISESLGTHGSISFHTHPDMYDLWGDPIYGPTGVESIDPYSAMGMHIAPKLFFVGYASLAGLYCVNTKYGVVHELPQRVIVNVEPGTFDKMRE
jgi:NADH:ubiquinone oxidoreductase subunit 5 (subunit L)/multisubunit Na+/H+ antiporter MnhA subunit